MSSHIPSREQLIQTLVRAIYASSTAAVFFHNAIAEQIGIGATEEKTLLILSEGPRTAGEIAQHTGLTTASVTNLVDRLEQKGFVRRVRDTHDRRRVIVEADEARLQELMQTFASLQGMFEDLMDAYSDEQLSVIADFVTRMTQRSQEATARLSQRLDDKASAGTKPPHEA